MGISNRKLVATWSAVNVHKLVGINVTKPEIDARLRRNVVPAARVKRLQGTRLAQLNEYGNTAAHRLQPQNSLYVERRVQPLRYVGCMLIDLKSDSGLRPLCHTATQRTRYKHAELRHAVAAFEDVKHAVAPCPHKHLDVNVGALVAFVDKRHLHFA